MATIAEQLTSLANTKTAIKNMIIARGVPVSDSDPFRVYPSKIAQISGGGGSGTVIINQDITVTENGTYTADAGYTGLGTVNVQVPNPSAGTINITENGSYDVVNFATAEVNVPTGGGAATKFGVSVDSLFGDVNENGIYAPPTETFNLDFTGITGFAQATKFDNFFANSKGVQDFIWRGIAEITDNKLTMQECFYSSSLKHAYLDDLETISNTSSYLFWAIFQGSSLETLTWKLRIVNANYCCYGMCNGCRQLTSTALDNLEEISGTSAFASGFSNCTKLTTTGLVKLKKINGNTACQQMFSSCIGLTKEYFYELVEVSSASAMNNMFQGCTNLTELHFRADAQAAIEAQSGYASKFGAPATCTIYFDL